MTETLERHHIGCKSIKNIPFFADLRNEEIENVEKLFVKKEYAKDQVVLLEEDTSKCMYLIYSGKVRVVKHNEEGREQIISIHRRNEFFGEMSLLDGKTNPATVIAHEDAVIGFLAKEDFEAYLLSNARFQRKIIDLLCRRLRDSWEMIKIVSFNAENAQDRVMSLLERLAELYGVKDQRGVIIDVKLTHQQMANFASVTRETMSRVLKNLVKENLIAIIDNKTVVLSKSFFTTRDKRPFQPITVEY
ncbi:Crp/Fnr family transcriptional regulator [Geomonas sp. Red276]